jgi:hypothetical protein
VCDQETSKNEEAKARYRAVKIHPQWAVTPGKQTINIFGSQITLLYFSYVYDKRHCGNTSICQFFTNKVFAQIS